MLTDHPIRKLGRGIPTIEQSLLQFAGLIDEAVQLSREPFGATKKNFRGAVNSPCHAQ